MEEAEKSGGDGQLESAEEHLYFLAIERVFIEERGSPLYLSPKDWQVALRWYEAGIPLEWVERTLREIFEQRRAKGTADKILSLGYCRRSVEAAWKRQQKMQAPDVEPEPAIDVAARLAALAAALPLGLAARDGWRRRIVELEGGAERVEKELEELDREMFAAVSADLDEGERRAIDDALARAMAHVARLPPPQLEEAKARLFERILRERLGLPVLSLFSPEAAP